MVHPDGLLDPRSAVRTGPGPGMRHVSTEGRCKGKKLHIAYLKSC